MSTAAKLMFLCGKMAAGKSTLARELAERENAVLLVQDEFLIACIRARSPTSRDSSSALPD
jgi:predicted kinase